MNYFFAGEDIIVSQAKVKQLVQNRNVFNVANDKSRLCPLKILQLFSGVSIANTWLTKILGGWR